MYDLWRHFHTCIFSLWTKRRSWRRWFARSRSSWRMPDEHLEPLTRREAIISSFFLSVTPLNVTMDDKDNLFRSRNYHFFSLFKKKNAAKSRDSACGNLTAWKAKGYIPLIFHCCQNKKNWKCESDILWEIQNKSIEIYPTMNYFWERIQLCLQNLSFQRKVSKQMVCKLLLGLSKTFSVNY